MLAGSVAGLCLLLCACSLEDDRDICCGNIRMEIRYVPYGVEELATYIRSPVSYTHLTLPTILRV